MLSTTACLAVLGSQPAAQEPVASGDSAAKVVEIVRLQGAPPLIDGRLDEGVWSAAAVVDDLHMIDPTEYAEPSEPTEIRLLYDSETLYVGARLWDSEPAGPTARILRQGERVSTDDLFAIILDPFYDRRNGYRFDVNANGVRDDALYQNTNRQLRDWDGIWRVAAAQHEHGWDAEVAIPFKTLSFDPAGEAWGVNFVRFLARKNEWNGWVSRNRNVSPSIAGSIVGFENIDQGLGLDIVPSVSVREQKRFSANVSDSSAEPSLDIFYRFTPSLSGSLTFNTDFSATEVDDRQVDLSRFSLFFPEKRAFFLKDSDIFEFGGLGPPGGFGGGPTFPRPSLENGRPFFSRRVGLGPDGTPVDLQYGGKLSGRVGRFSVGALAIRQDVFEDVEPTDVLVGRVVANVLPESSLGVLLTSGDPSSNLDNAVIGIDFRYQNSRLRGGRELQAEAWVQQSDTEGLAGEDRAFGLRLSTPNRNGFRGSMGLKELEENFNPALGFVSRRGIRDRTLELGFTRVLGDRYLRTAFAGVDVQRIDLLSGGLQTETVTLRALELENHTRDTFKIAYTANEETVTSPFELSENVIIAPGRYSFDEHGFDLATGSQRALSGGLVYRSGKFFGGERVRVRGEMTWGPSRHFRAGFGYELNDVDLPEGDFVVRLATMRLAVIFSSRLSWVNLIQYDNVSETAGINSRLHWVPEAGREGFIVLNHNLQDLDGDDSFRSESADLTLKFNYTFRF